jgi:hypothetical protein
MPWSVRRRSAGGRPDARRAARALSDRSRHVPGYEPGGPCGALDAASMSLRISRRLQKHSYTEPAAARRSIAASYRSKRSLCLTTSPSQSRPSAAMSRSCAASCLGRAWTRSRSSIRTRNGRPSARADSHATTAVRRFPRCNSPVGDGANRPVMCTSWRAGQRRTRRRPRAPCITPTARHPM